MSASVTKIPSGDKFTGFSSDVTRRILLYGTSAQYMLENQFSIRGVLQWIDRVYQREMDWTVENLRARWANAAGDSTKFQNLQFPIVMPQVESTLGYLMNVFLTGYPIFSVAASPDQMEAAKMIESVIEENSRYAGWSRELIMFFRDGLKYNLCAVEVDWCQETNYTVETDISAPNSAKKKSVNWQGNKLKRLDLYNSFFDIRVPPSRIHLDGEFAGYNEVLSRVQFKQFVNNLFTNVSRDLTLEALNSTPAMGVAASGMAPYTYYIPTVNPSPTIQPLNLVTFNWVNWAEATTRTDINYSNVYIVTTLYARILPADFGMAVPERNTPQIWKFVIVNGAVVLQALRMSNVHSKLPILFGQPIEDGLGYQTKSFASNVQDIQALCSSMWQGFIASKRRLVGDRVLYDPSRISEQAINSTNPAAKIPVRPAAYGKNIGESVYAFPYRDDNTNSFVQAADALVRAADIINGQNPAQQGQFVKGNKTLHEYDDVMGHGNVNKQMMAITLENQVLIPLKEIVKLNIMQYQPDMTVFNSQLKQNVSISGPTLRQASVAFKVSDGLVPEDKIMSTEELGMALQAIGSSPQLGAGYNLAPMFSYLMSLKGADLKPFEKSPETIQYEQALQAWQQAAINAADKGVAFSSPQPQPPQAQQQQGPQVSSGQPAPAMSLSQAVANTQGNT